MHVLMCVCTHTHTHTHTLRCFPFNYSGFMDDNGLPHGTGTGTFANNASMSLCGQWNHGLPEGDVVVSFQSSLSLCLNLERPTAADFNASPHRVAPGYIWPAMHEDERQISFALEHGPSCGKDHDVRTTTPLLKPLCLFVDFPFSCCRWLIPNDRMQFQSLMLIRSSLCILELSWTGILLQKANSFFPSWQLMTLLILQPHIDFFQGFFLVVLFFRGFF